MQNKIEDVATSRIAAVGFYFAGWVICAQGELALELLKAKFDRETRKVLLNLEVTWGTTKSQKLDHSHERYCQPFAQ